MMIVISRPEVVCDVVCFRLRDVLYAYIESKDGDPFDGLFDGSFPESILAEQAVEVWKMLI